MLGLEGEVRRERELTKLETEDIVASEGRKRWGMSK